MAKKPYLQASGPEWDRQRMRAMVRDDFHCRAHELGLCDEPCLEDRPRFLIVHHKMMRAHGGTHDLNNLITLCKEHHAKVHPWLAYEESKPLRKFEEDGFLREL